MITDGLPIRQKSQVTRVTFFRISPSAFRSPPNGPLVPITLQEDSRPASPFGDLMELIAGEKLVLLKELHNLIEKRFGVGRRQSILHIILLIGYHTGDGAAPSQCGEELL